MKTLDCVLIVEDTDVDRRLAASVLRKVWPNVRILEARDGEEAIEVLARCGMKMPEIILLDVNMPKMNGHDFLKAWYADGEMEIPVVVMLTSSNQSIDRERAEGFSCVRDYVVKPITKATATSLLELAGVDQGIGRP